VFFVKKMKPEDFPFAVNLANTMNWEMGASDFEFNMQLEPEGCLVLFNNFERIGIATCISYGKVGWFGNLAVKDSYRRQGAGTLLVRSAVDFLKAKGVTTIGLYAYPHLVNFYRKIGFKPDAEFDVLQTNSVQVSFFTKNEEKIKQYGMQDISSIVNFDAMCFGASRRKTIELLLKERNNLCFTAKEGKEVVGYSAAKVSYGLAEVGPLVCKKSHIDLADSLLGTTLDKLIGYCAYLYIPKEEGSLIDAANYAGFKTKFSLVRMFLGLPVAKDCVYIAESLERG
jgi:ribosomal protein S18 acetylase RimI-like enzyme